MNRRTFRTIIYVCSCLLLSVWMRAGLCVCAESAAPAPGERLILLAGEHTLTLRTDLSGEYTLFAFAAGEVRAQLTAGSGVIAEGALPLTFTMRENEAVEAVLTADQPFTLEWMRAALGRSALTPLELTEGALNRSLTRARDVHWFRFTAETAGEYLVSAERAVKSGVRTEILILNEKGELLAEPRLMEDACAAFVALEAGESCLIRVSAGTATGNYVLTAQKAAPAGELSSPRAELQLRVGEWTGVPVSPAAPVIWASDAPDVATVNVYGIVAAQSVGECTVTAYAPDGQALSIPVTVSPTQVLGVTMTHAAITLSQGEEIYVDYSVQPVFAHDAAVLFASADAAVARVTADGRLTAVGMGQTEITVTTVEGGFSARMTVEVTEPRPVRRALVVGIASYTDGRSRMGSVNTTQGVADALSQTVYGENNYQTVMRLDLTGPELIEEIQRTFADAAANDISLVYINCHGNSFAGVPFLEMHDGGFLSARELEEALRAVPGTVIVVLDCCFSGAFIGKAAGTDDFAHGVINVFSQPAAEGGVNAFAADKYKVLVSSSRDQNSYRMASSTPAVESGMSTVFGRAFTEALGWDLIKDRAGEIRADLDSDRRVTLNEAFLYVRRRAMYYLTRSPASAARQYAQVWPEGDSFAIIG